LDEQAYLDAMATAAAAAEERDSVLGATRSNDSREVIRAALREAAAESSALGWERARAQRLGRSGLVVERLSARRTNSLFRLVDLTLALMQLDVASPDPYPAEAERVVALLMAEVEKVVREVAEPAMADAFMASVRAQMVAANFPACCSRQGPAPGMTGDRGGARGGGVT
jgi:hypothetical protein